MGYVYLVTNLTNDKKYVGKTICELENRKQGHYRLSKSGQGFLFHKALRKYGFEKFKWEILFQSVNEDILFKVELMMILELNTKVPSGYNLTDGGDGIVGATRTKVWRDSIRSSLLGKSHTKERIEKIKVIRASFMQTEQYRRRVSEGRKGIKPSLETREKIRVSRTGKRHTPETKEKMRQSARNRWKSKEARKIQSRKLQGRVLSEETKLKMILSAKNRKKPVPVAI